MDWFSSIHSAVNKYFVSNPYPTFFEEVKVSLRISKNNPIKRIFLRRLINGTNAHIEMKIERETKKFKYYSTNITINEKFINYHFVILTNDTVYYYNKKETLNYPPTEDNDFVIIADFENPAWVLKSVFYQIFPDRFYDGNPSNDVKDGEYSFDGHPTKKNNWGDKAPDYFEGFCVDFYGGDLQGIKQKIPYFKELGINALYLNPIFEAKTNHKYDCTDFFNVDKYFGGNEAFIDLVNELHKNNIKVIVDVSINHTGTEHHWYKKALADPNSEERTFYYFDKNGVSKKWRGMDTLPQLNYSSQKLRDIIYEGVDNLIEHYLKPPYNIDGWRFDVAMDVGKYDKDQFGSEIFRSVRKKAKEVKKDCYLIGEHWKDNISYLLGDQLDGAMNYFVTSRPLRCFAGEMDRYLATDNILPYNSNYNVTGGIELKNQIIQHLGRLPDQIAFLQFNLIDSHDFHRFHNNKEKFDFDIYRGLIIVLFMIPGTPSIYYGDEIGIDGYIETVEGCRYSMEWDRSKWNNDILNLYKKLIFLKTNEASFQDGSYKILFASYETFVIARFTDTKCFIGILSKTPTQTTIYIPLDVVGGIDDTIFKDVFTNEQFTVKNGSLQITLNKNQSLLLAGDVDG
ncbi:MAG: hypothetical protein A2086_03195 [Spirochaetes bacterium GWD1_27_9]|nr:MAG: hypothetical protein A2Z98_12870 [Spirochaetes bacterium GWB1_27_13]OHD20692.1 MAG: hypothetical protein A2Y34_14165 [Spirochaetes bacterium GWC1_27_15]OHD38703.1 MAG: hypothetical protein A2086_03195 [Spirochaetes bacterium GWD1_27_9]